MFVCTRIHVLVWAQKCKLVPGYEIVWQIIVISSNCFTLGRNFALTHQVRSFRDQETKVNMENRKGKQEMGTR